MGLNLLIFLENLRIEGARGPGHVVAPAPHRSDTLAGSLPVNTAGRALILGADGCFHQAVQRRVDVFQKFDCLGRSDPDGSVEALSDSIGCRKFYLAFVTLGLPGQSHGVLDMAPRSEGARGVESWSAMPPRVGRAELGAACPHRDGAIMSGQERPRAHRTG